VLSGGVVFCGGRWGGGGRWRFRRFLFFCWAVRCAMVCGAVLVAASRWRRRPQTFVLLGFLFFPLFNRLEMKGDVTPFLCALALSCVVNIVPVHRAYASCLRIVRRVHRVNYIFWTSCPLCIYLYIYS
jgi:hypothetical protein